MGMTDAPFPPTEAPPEQETTTPSHNAITFAPFHSLAPTPAPPFAAPNTPLAPVAVPATAAPTGPVSRPTPRSGWTVPVPAYYIAFSAPLAEREPTDDEYLLLTQLTTMYFEQRLAAQYQVDPVVFERVDTVLVDDQYLATTTPDLPYNIYLTFNTSVVFAPRDGASASALPSGQALLDIMDGAIGASYIVNYVWQATETPFISTNDVSLNSVPVIQPMDDVASSPVEAAKANRLEDWTGRFVLPGGSRISSHAFHPVKDPSLRY
jgi:hypothetical protein